MYMPKRSMIPVFEEQEGVSVSGRGLDAGQRCDPPMYRKIAEGEIIKGIAGTVTFTLTEMGSHCRIPNNGETFDVYLSQTARGAA